jgi:hypothetical protein
LVGDAAVIDGALVTSFQNQWMEMPGDVIAMNTYSEVSIETWCTPPAGLSTSWSTLAYFGGQNPNTNYGVDYFFIATTRPHDNSRTAISVGDYSSPWEDETGVDGPELDDGLLHHIVSTLTATDISLYVDGILIGSAELVGDNHIDGISQQLAYLAKSGYPDPVWSGSIEEFNIYDKALSPAQVQAKCAAGPHPLPDHSGSVVGWGRNNYGQATPPADNDCVAVAAGREHSLALKQDGSIIGWGSDSEGQATPPDGNDYVAIAAGRYHSLALKKDGSIVSWGWDADGQATPPAGNDYVAIAAGGFYSLALKQDGSIVGWGSDSVGQSTPPDGNDYIAITAGRYHSLALKLDGSIVGWGGNSYGQATAPVGNDYVAIAAGEYHSLALKQDGSIVGWGMDNGGQATPPAGNDYIAIAAGGRHSLALRQNGTVVGWGWNSYRQAISPVGSDYVAIAAGQEHSLANREPCQYPKDR